MRSVWSLKTPSMPMSTNSSSRRSSWRVPRECVALEAVEERREPARPVAVVQVDGVDPGVGELRRSSLGAVFHRAQPGRVDQFDVGIERPATTRRDASRGGSTHRRSVAP